MRILFTINYYNVFIILTKLWKITLYAMGKLTFFHDWSDRAAHSPMPMSPMSPSLSRRSPPRCSTWVQVQFVPGIAMVYVMYGDVSLLIVRPVTYIIYIYIYICETVKVLICLDFDGSTIKREDLNMRYEGTI